MNTFLTLCLLLRILTDYNQLPDVSDAGDGKNVGGLNTGVRRGEGLEGGSPFNHPPLRCAEKLTHFYPVPSAQSSNPSYCMDGSLTIGQSCEM